MPKGTIQNAYILPGLPHLTSQVPAASWEALRRSFRQAGEHMQQIKPDVLVIYSTQWNSVLGHSFQADPNPKGVHVDDNWYEFGDFPFDLRVDAELGTRAAAIASSFDLATKTINYNGFPIDTGVLVVQRFVNLQNIIPVAIVSCNI